MSTALTCVVDASVAIKLFMVEPLSTEANALFTCLTDPASAFHVPDLFFAECANILWKHTQRGTCTPAVATAHFAALAKLPLQTTPLGGLCPDALTLALAHNISVYDACYVALSQQKGVPLITADQKLVQKLTALTPPIIWLGNWTSPTPATP